MPAMSVGGLASGLDTNSIITQLTALEQAKVTREAKKKEAAQSTLDKFKELQTRLGTLQSKANGLSLPANFNVFASTSNYPEYAQVKGGEGATAGQYEITINQLATTQKVASKSFAAVNTAIGEGGTITLSTSIAAQKKDSTKKTVDVKIEASDTLRDIVNKINAAEGTGVRASLMTPESGDNRLVLTAVDTGTNGFFISEPSGGNLLTNVLGILDDSEQKVKSGNALVTIGGRAATAEGKPTDTKFNELDTNLGKNNLGKNDVVGIYLPNGGWQTYSIHDGTNFKTIKEVLDEINQDLHDSGADFTASLNSSGEIIVQGKLDVDGNFNSSNLGKVKIQIISSNSDYGTLDKDDLKDALNDASVRNEKILDSYGAEGGTIKTAAAAAADAAALDAVAAAGLSIGDPEYQAEYDKAYNKTYNEEINNAILNKIIEEKYKKETDPAKKAELIQAELDRLSNLTSFERDKLIEAEMFSVKKDVGKFSKANVFAEENFITEAQNAFYTLNGMGVSSQSNEDDKIISGTTFVLLKKTEGKLDEPVKVSLELDQNALVDKIAGFIEEFNALLRYIDENAKATIKEEENPVTGKKTNTRVVGPFTGDSAVNSIRDQLKAMMTSTINHIAKGLNGANGENGYKGTEYSSASRIGITTNREGYLDIDRDKLNKALTADFEGIRKLFSANSFSDTNGFRVGNFNKNSKAGVYEVNATTGEVTLNGEKVEATVYGNIITTKDGLSFEVPSSGTAKVTFVRGIASQIQNFVEIAKSLTVTLSNGKVVPGYFKQTEKTYQERIDNIQDRIDVLQRRVDSYNIRITNQFSALERSMSTLQSQTANMMSALSNMNYNRR